MKVTVIVPAFNAEKTVCATLDSLLKQTYANVEILVINDGSQDRTKELLESYGDRIRAIHKNNGGVSSVRNLGIQEARGEYIMFADADDVCYENMIESVVRRQQQTQADFVIAGYTKVKTSDRSDVLPGNEFFPDKQAIRSGIERILGNNLNCPYCKLYRTDIIREKGISFDTHLPLGEDMNFNLEYLLQVQSLAYLNESLYDYLIFNSVATTVYRPDMYQRRILSLKKMNDTFAQHGLQNPVEGDLRIKILYAVVLNLQKNECALSWKEKIEQINRAKVACIKGKTKTHGLFALLRIAAKCMPSSVLYCLGWGMQMFMRILPEHIRGISV